MEITLSAIAQEENAIFLWEILKNESQPLINNGNFPGNIKEMLQSFFETYIEDSIERTAMSAFISGGLESLQFYNFGKVNLPKIISLLKKTNIHRKVINIIINVKIKSDSLLFYKDNNEVPFAEFSNSNFYFYDGYSHNYYCEAIKYVEKKGHQILDYKFKS